MSMFGSENPRERIYEILREMQDEGVRPYMVAAYCAEALSVFMQNYEPPKEDEDSQ